MCGRESEINAALLLLADISGRLTPAIGAEKGIKTNEITVATIYVSADILNKDDKSIQDLLMVENFVDELSILFKNRFVQACYKWWTVIKYIN